MEEILNQTIVARCQRRFQVRYFLFKFRKSNPIFFANLGIKRNDSLNNNRL